MRLIVSVINQWWSIYEKQIKRTYLILFKSVYFTDI